ASNAPDSRLETIVRAIEAAADRGVRVRFLAEEKFYRTYPRTLDRLARRSGIEVRRYDVAALAGGVLHAKYFIVDTREAFAGSQNFDWRALTHIQELGLRIRIPGVVRALTDVFETDWALAAGADPGFRASPPPDGYGFPAVVTQGEDTLRVTPVFSPTGWLPDEALWDLPRLLEMIDSARENVRVQLLSYRTVGRDGTYFGELESALRRAAARGVRVQLLVADWSKRRGTIEGLQSLQTLPDIEVNLVTIPEWSGGFVPYARVIHAKYLVVDARSCWLGTSNWEKDYFHRSRNVGLLVEGRALARRLDRYFVDNWNGRYAERVDPGATYEAPRIGN
ncbi:MAG: phospholipase D-like domain-containing protein, partial [Candidatus Krumholzibacteriia bacterium]